MSKVKKYINGILAIAIVGTSLLTAAKAGAASNQLTVKITTRNAKGQICVALWNNAKGFPSKENQALQKQCVKISGKTATATFGGLEAGDYAVSAMHDENENQKLDTNFVGIPTEGYGFSNNARGTLGSPSYNAAKFKFSGSQTISFNIRY
jgi:uncharacterized protein (DUF2141 family)